VVLLEFGACCFGICHPGLQGFMGVGLGSLYGGIQGELNQLKKGNKPQLDTAEACYLYVWD